MLVRAGRPDACCALLPHAAALHHRIRATESAASGSQLAACVCAEHSLWLNCWSMKVELSLSWRAGAAVAMAGRADRQPARPASHAHLAGKELVFVEAFTSACRH